MLRMAAAVWAACGIAIAGAAEEKVRFDLRSDKNVKYCVSFCARSHEGTNVGHCWVAWFREEQGFPAELRIRGFYPKNAGLRCAMASCDGAVKDEFYEMFKKSKPDGVLDLFPPSTHRMDVLLDKKLWDESWTATEAWKDEKPEYGVFRAKTCKDFVHACAKAVGFGTPRPGKTDFPEEYLKKLIDQARKDHEDVRVTF